MDLITTIEGVSNRPDGTVVTVGLPEDASLSGKILEMRGRARAMVEAGVVSVAGNSARQIVDAARNLSFAEIGRATEVVADRGDEIDVLVRN